jgi:copper(I)-binding protein
LDTSLNKLAENVAMIGIWIKLVVVALTLTLFPAAARPQKSADGPWRLGEVVVEQAWARVVPDGAKTGAVYLTIHNRSSEEELLFAVESDAAQSITIHESSEAGGVASMEPLPMGVLLPGHGEVVMRPGGIHIMMSGLSGALTPGSFLPLRMIFRDNGTLELEVPVLPLNSEDPAIKHLGHNG